MKLICAVLLLTMCAAAQDHKFWDRQQKIEFASTLAVRGADIAQTCYNISANTYTKTFVFPDRVVTVQKTTQEGWLPVKSCAGIASYVAGEQVVQTLVQYGLFRRHHRSHSRLERFIPVIWTAPNAAGIAVSFTH